MIPTIEQFVDKASEVILGKRQEIRVAVACIIARGHLLIEDLPGVGKTTLAHVLARLMGLNFQRIQFTSDLLPADILGVSIFERDSGSFRFHPGPIFAQLILADEINRATPKTQSALLEAMEEHQVTAEGETRPLPQPFFVIATQNPAYQIGTFPLPESQLDRFLMRIALGFPGHDAERALLQGRDRRDMVADLAPCMDTKELAALQERATRVYVAEALLDYLQKLLQFTRLSNAYQSGLSPRAGLALLHSAKAWAFIEGRDKVLPEDIQAVLPHVTGHRLKSKSAGDQDAVSLAQELIHAVPIP